MASRSPGAAALSIPMSAPREILSPINFLTVYNPTLGNAEERAQDQILFWTDEDELDANRTGRRLRTSHSGVGVGDRYSSDERLHQIALAREMVALVRNFTNDDQLCAIETERSRIILLELEKDWWILVSINLTYSPPVASQARNDLTSVKPESQLQPGGSECGIVPAAQLRVQLIEAYGRFISSHNSGLWALYHKLGRHDFCKQLSKYWEWFARRWDVLLHENSITNTSQNRPQVTGMEELPGRTTEGEQDVAKSSDKKERVHKPAQPPQYNGVNEHLRMKANTSRIRGNSTFINFFRNLDWASTAMGPIETWSQQLVELCNFMLASPDPIGIYWGNPPTALYNEPIVATIGDRHPEALGKYVKDAYPELWEEHFKPLFETLVEKKQPWLQYIDRRLGYRDGKVEEVFWNVTFVPILDERNEVAGTFGILYDVTIQHFWQRRVAKLLKLTESMNVSNSFDDMWNALLGSFEAGDRDVPHIIIYTASERTATTSGTHASARYGLWSSLGYDTNVTPYHDFNIEDNKHPLSRLLQQTLGADAPLRFEKTDINLPAEFWNAFCTVNPNDTCKSIVVLPIRPGQGKDALSFLVIGLNPLVRYDQDYREFIDLVLRQVSSAMASIVLREEELKRERLVAEEASHQLSRWKAESRSHEIRFTRLAEIAPIGICTYGVDGSLTYANDVYRAIFGMSPEDDASGSEWWDHLVHPEDLLMAKMMFGRLLIERQGVTFEIRVKARPDYKSIPSPGGYIWVLVSAYAEPTGSGPQTVIACFTDINEQKRAEDHQNKRLQDMMNAKRQQEAFIDMTSHEIRNPLSVVLQCSEEIISICTTLRTESQGKKLRDASEDTDNVLDAAETIQFCTLHQKHIVDDILTLSKLESNLLPVTLDHVQPLILVEGVMKLFEREIRKSDMRMSINIHPTFHDQHLMEVMIDPSRVSQIIINLVSNAIKFTKTQDERRLEVILGASSNRESPPQDWPVSYMPRQLPVQQNGFAENWNDSQSAYLHFAVIDTGAGLSVEEQQKLFSRFTQATPRTHVKYGGSGLGLYICRALSETHGGQIGCSSVPGKGSAFGFYVRVGRIAEPLISSVETTTQSQSLGEIKATISKTNPTSNTPVPAVGAASVNQGKEIANHAAFNILVVEDNILNQKVLRRQLERAGHFVVVAHHGQDALDLLPKSRSWNGVDEGSPSFDFILMDIEMPVMNGLICTTRIREFERQGLMDGHVPIIATTGNARDEKIGMALAAGMDEVVLKPYSLSVLLPIAQTLCEKYGRR